MDPNVFGVVFLLCSAPAALRSALAAFTVFATAEAEFGDELVEGSAPALTLAHHGPRSKNPPPCDDRGVVKVAGLQAIGLSHLDLDALGGVMRLLGLMKPGDADFWRVAGMVDVRGPHRLADILRDVFSIAGDMDEVEAQYCASVHVRRALQAFWAWSETHRVSAPRDGSVLDVSAQVAEAIDAVQAILDGDEVLLAAGDAWAASKEELERSSFRRLAAMAEGSAVVVREAEGFVNHLYEHALGVAQGCAALTARPGQTPAVTVSLADPVPGVSCREIVQALWGPGAGGHDGIAGSPRGRAMTAQDLDRAAAALAEALARAEKKLEEA